MPNYDLPKPTPSEALAERFDRIAAEGLEPAMAISRSLDAIADAIRLYAEDPAVLLDLAQQVSASAFNIGSVATIAPAPAPAPKGSNKKASTAAPSPEENG